MTHILQYRAARARQDSLTDNLKIRDLNIFSIAFFGGSPKKLTIGLFVERGSASSRLSMDRGSRAAEEEAESSAVEWLRFIQQLLLLLLAARTAGTGHLANKNWDLCECPRE